MLVGLESVPPLPSPESLRVDLERYPDLSFAVQFALQAGGYMREGRESAEITIKPDGTRVTDVEWHINDSFVMRAIAHSGGLATILGEEGSSVIQGSRDRWIIDPVDGTRQYTEPSAKKLIDGRRHSSIGIAKFANGTLQTGVVFNPFREELYYADRDLGSSLVNGVRLDLTQNDIDHTQFDPSLPYNYTAYKGAPTDSEVLRNIMEYKPLGHVGSTLYQACLVARGVLAFSVFPGRNVHDIAPGALVVELAAGHVSDTSGGAIDWGAPNGAVYAVSSSVQNAVVTGLVKYNASSGQPAIVA